MAEKKKMGAGLVLSVITVLVTVAGLALYVMNCKTNYFAKTTGIDNKIAVCLAVAAILEIVMIAASDHSCSYKITESVRVHDNSCLLPADKRFRNPVHNRLRWNR